VVRAVVQRVSEASVVVDGGVVGAVGRGLLVYLGVGADDVDADVDLMALKVATLRVFHDAEGKMSRSVEEEGGSILVVSQFTLFGDVRKGRRPSFTDAAPPELAETLYSRVVERLRERGIPVETGRFRAHMDVRSSVDGPVTILIDSRKTF
jgi:D-tyrosyl-tRNA(Tyr) deacylase